MRKSRIACRVGLVFLVVAETALMVLLIDSDVPNCRG